MGDEWFLINIVENNYINGQIFEPFVKLLENEKEGKHIANIFKMARKSQKNMWDCSSTSVSEEIKTKNDENVNECNGNGNGNPYLDQTLITKQDTTTMK